MGDKVRARRFAVEHGVPVTPAADEADDPASFAERAAAVGFPLLVKGAAGGGGKGMQIVREPAHLAEAIAVARRESERYFGDARLLAERFVERPRHIEVQVFGDAHGRVIHLGERECSIQRRFQKLIEETPAPGLDPALRERICAAAVRLARAAGYVNAGTVECIVSPQGEFFFLEMNTRLQVEHPVTECVTGLDLVEWQLRVAAGEPLPLAQEQVRWQGHAIEARLLAEDADAGFVPDTGRVHRLRWAEGPGLRVDAGVTAGSPVTADFDSMLAKLVGHGATRALAISRLAQALQDTVLLGPTVNADYLARVLRHPAFQRGEVDTGFVQRHRDALRPSPPSDAQRRLLLAVAARALPEPALRAAPEPYAAMGAWRN
jgi:propionyl-CoA carboxylase alpha chain/3-methylcrotonyl-CoA carboxylase alpha subunit/acetyl-CoA/propionyl-CoA carboxylase biotin carboxyl carrier protein